MSMIRTFLKKFIGTRAFYRMVLALAVPVMIQNGITNFVGMLDNIMVGQIGTEQMSGVAIANQLVFVFNLCCFGGMSGAGIFAAQYFGKSDHAGVRDVMRVKLWFAAILTVAGYLVLTVFGEPLIRMFLHEGSETGDLAATLAYGLEYLKWIRGVLLPFALMQAYASTLRETGQTKPPMRAGVIATLVNLVFNWLLIFGNLGFPALGVVGAAIATVLSRVVEIVIILTWTHRHTAENRFTVGLYRSFRVPAALLRQVARSGCIIMLNEMLWSSGMTMLNRCYSLRGLAVVAATNISSTITHMFAVVFMACGGCIGIVVGNLLGANKMEEARDANTKMTAFSVACGFLVALLSMLSAPLFPNLYNTTAEVRTLATAFILISAAFEPFHAYSHACYFTLRSGGKVFLTFLYDAVFVWAINVPVAFVLAEFTSLPITVIYLCSVSTQIIKCILGYAYVRSGRWMNHIV